MQIITLIPAAGKGSRFGMPKVDASYNGISFAQRIIDTLEEAGLTDYYLLRDLDTPDMQTTLRHGMRLAITEGRIPDGWLIWPVDHPTVKAATVMTLASIFERKSNSVIIPRNGGRNGHPILIPGALLIPAQPDPLGLKGIIHSSGFPILYADVDDVGILFNFNTPEDMAYA